MKLMAVPVSVGLCLGDVKTEPAHFKAVMQEYGGRLVYSRLSTAKLAERKAAHQPAVVEPAKKWFVAGRTPGVDTDDACLLAYARCCERPEGAT